MELEQTRVYTVTELTRDIRFMLEGTFGEIWVEGEVSNLTLSSAGHAYFSLKDKGGLLNCVLFRGDSSRLAFAVEGGMQVLCHGRISVYDKRGQYQLYVKRMEPCGRGALQQAFEQLKEKLRKEGLFDEEHKKELPFLPVRIGIITSPTGAAIRDILKVAGRRFANIEILIRPVRVQGSEAKYEISDAVRELNEFNSYADKKSGAEEGIDVIIVGRGGGSLEDLWPFNEEIVARAIFASKIPVVSAVGHEIDYTISDLVADLRAPTPSAAAERVIPLKDELVFRIKELRERAYLAIKRRTDTLEKEVGRLRSSYVLRAPTNVFMQLGQQVDELARAATSGMKNILVIRQHELRTVTGKIEALSPLAVLERGYSITFRNGRVIKSSATLKTGDRLQTVFARGETASRVESVTKSSREEA